MRRLLLCACGAAALMTISVRARADLLQNGSFESPAIPANSKASITPDSWYWTGSVGAGWVFNDPVYISTLPLAEDGSQYVDIGFNGIWTLSQSFTVSSPGAYDLTWYDNTAINPPGPSLYGVKIRDDLAQIIVNQTFDAAHAGAWQQVELPLTLSSGTYTLTFSGNSSGYDSLIDNVSLTSVPEPSSLALLGVAVGALIARSRKR
jgi:hypothetical protein